MQHPLYQILPAIIGTTRWECAPAGDIIPQGCGKRLLQVQWWGEYITKSPGCLGCCKELARPSHLVVEKQLDMTVLSFRVLLVWCVRVGGGCMHACVRACVSACVCAYVGVCVSVCVSVCARAWGGWDVCGCVCVLVCASECRFVRPASTCAGRQCALWRSLGTT